MADDIDDLLDEVESKFCETEPKKQALKKSSKTGISSSSGKTKTSGLSGRSKLENELSDAVNDILDDDDLDLELDKRKKTSVIRNDFGGIKCYPIFISGTKPSSKVNSTRICDRLHCTSCDNTVVSFDNFEWHKSCDYLFFRNNYPDFSKLKSNMIPRAGSRSYCCQCCWTAVKTVTNLNQSASFKWICKKH